MISRFTSVCENILFWFLARRNDITTIKSLHGSYLKLLFFIFCLRRTLIRHSVPGHVYKTNPSKKPITKHTRIQWSEKFLRFNLNVKLILPFESLIFYSTLDLDLSNIFNLYEQWNRHRIHYEQSLLYYKKVMKSNYDITKHTLVHKLITIILTPNFQYFGNIINGNVVAKEEKYV